MSAETLTAAVDGIDLPALIAEQLPDSGAKPGKEGEWKNTQRGETHASGSVFKEHGVWFWKDHGTGRKGNAYQWLTDVLNMAPAEAAKTLKDFSGVNGGASGKAAPYRTVATYPYFGEDGTLLYEVLRQETTAGDKRFFQRHPCRKGRDGFNPGLGGKPDKCNCETITPVLYRLPHVLEAIGQGHSIFITEGEKDVHTLEALGLVATCNPMGAGKWRDSFSESLAAADIIILPDNDRAGRDHARAVAASLKNHAASIRIVNLPDLPPKGDATDWHKAGGTLETLQGAVKAARSWCAADETPFDGFVSTALGDADETLSGEEPWADRLELPSHVPSAPALPPEMIPAPLREWLQDIAERSSLPLEFPTAAAIVALSAVVGRKLGIKPKQRDNWLVVPNLWGAVVGRPGSMKSAAVTEGTLPLVRLAIEAREQYEQALSDAEALKDMLEIEVAAIKKKMSQAANKGGDPAGLQEELKEKRKALQEAVTTERRYSTQDATVEKLGELLRENPNGLLILRDEIAGWLGTLDRPGREGDREFYLEAWNGTGGYTFDRIGRGTVHIPAVALSIFGGIQPGKLHSYIQGALSEGAGADGLLQRFQVLVWPDKLSDYKHVDRYPNTEAKNRAYEVFRALDNLDPAAVGAKDE